MMNLFDLPAGLLVLLFTTQVSSAVPRTLQRPWKRDNITVATTGSGPQYASACSAASSSYNSAYTSWISANQRVENQTQVIGGNSWSLVTYYENGTTLCDGHARVPQTPAVPLSSATVTYTAPVYTTEITPLTYFSNYNAPSPTCSIAPSDCDPLWQAYSSSSSAYNSMVKGSGTVGTGSAQITSPPQTPPCLNQTAAAAWASATSSLYGCGMCTIYGEGVELVYFPEPTTVSRDMCASTPVATQTYYGDGAIIEAYAGTAYGRNGSRLGGKTAIVGQNTFTSGTAYISIATVYAQDRCASTRGTPVYNAILAMPSESVLSLRYSQDHFQWAAVTAIQTGYPVVFEDFNHPVPWSAWNGQAQCDPNGVGGYMCDVIYEDNYKPQLAIPPEINQLNAEWSDCQLWYGGLYDPPLALQPAESIAAPTVPGQLQQATSTAAPSSTAAAPTVTATALSDVIASSQSATQQQSAQSSATQQQSAQSSATQQQSAQSSATQQQSVQPSATQEQIVQASATQQQSVQSLSTQQQSVQFAASIAQPTVPVAIGASQSTTQQQSQPAQGSSNAAVSSQGGSGAGTSTAWTQAITANGQTLTASACGANACIGTVTISASQPAQTLADGIIASYVLSGLGIQGSSTIALPTTTLNNAASGPSGPGQTSVTVHTVVTIGTQVISVQQAGSNGVVVAGSATLVPGGAATTLQNGQVLSAGTGGVVVGWSSEYQAGAQATITAGNAPMATPTRIIISAVSASVVIDGSTIAIPTSVGSATTVVINGLTHTITSEASGVAVVDGVITLTASGAAATMTQMVGTGVVAGSPTLTIGNSGYAVTPLGTTGYVINGQTVANGGQVTVGGQVVSLEANGDGVVVVGGTSSQTLIGTRIAGLPSLTVGSSAFAVTPLGTTGYVINGQTVSNGGQVTVDGQVVSLQSNGIVVVGGTSTESLASASALTTTAGGTSLGGSASSTTAATAAETTTKAGGVSGRSQSRVGTIVILVAFTTTALLCM